MGTWTVRATATISAVSTTETYTAAARAGRDGDLKEYDTEHLAPSELCFDKQVCNNKFMIPLTSSSAARTKGHH